VKFEELKLAKKEREKYENYFNGVVQALLDF